MVLGSIKRKLIWLVLLATLPVFLVLLWTGIQERNDEILLAQHDTTIFLRGFSEIQRRITDSTRTLLRTTAESPGIKRLDPKESHKILASLLKANPMYSNVMLVNYKGDVVVMGKGKVERLNFADRRQFRKAIQTGKFSYGEFVTGKHSGKWIFPFGMPVVSGSGKTVGALIIGISLDHYATAFDNTNFPAGSFLGACDHNGIRIFRHPSVEGVTIGKPIKKYFFDQVKDQKHPGTLAGKMTEGVYRIIAYDPLRLEPDATPYMYMFMGLDRSQVLGRADHNFFLRMLVSILSFCIAAGGAWFMGWQSIARNINKLSYAAKQLARGKEHVSSNINYADGELGELARSFDTMSRVLQKREADLYAAKRTAESASKAKDEFLANISHEVRTPLNGVMGMLQLLQETKLDDEQESLLATAYQLSRNLLKVLNDLLEFITAGSGKMQVHKEAFDLKSLVEQCRNVFQLQAEEKGIDFQVTISPDAQGMYVSDVGRIRQIFLNLLGNAIKFTQEGGVYVDVFCQPYPHADTVRLFFSIRDSGVGIPDDKLEYVFDAFTQVDGSLSRKYKGTGLGLPIVKRLLRLLSGNCTIESEQGKGTTIIFSVPVGVEHMSMEPLFSSPPVVSKALTVLLVEDEEINRLMAKRLLEHMGHSVICAENGQRCLELLDKHPVDVILMDVQMPVLDGLQATEAIRTSSKFAAYATVPIIALSAHAAEQDKENALVAGVDYYLTKPFEKVALEIALQHVVQKDS